MGFFKRKAYPEVAKGNHKGVKSSSPHDTRLQLITGKGGVGRTTVTISLGRACANQGRNTLILEVRDAESELGEESAYHARADSMLGRAIAQEFNVSEPYQLGPDPLEVAPHLWAGQLVATIGHEQFLRSMIPSGRLARAALESKGLSRFLRSAPSMHELGIYYHLAQLQKHKQFDVIILDLPASGHTLALTELPARISRILRRGSLVDALHEGVGRIADPTQTSLWVVTLPEELPISEALELKNALNNDGIEPAGVIVNRSLPQALSDSEIQSIEYLLDQISPQDANEEAIEATLRAALTELPLRTQLNSFKREYSLPEQSDALARVHYISDVWFKE